MTVKRKKVNPRKQGCPRKERIDRSKMRQAFRQIVQSEVLFLDIMLPKDVDKKGNLTKKASKNTKDDMRPKYKALGDAVFDLEAEVSGRDCCSLGWSVSYAIW